MSRSFSRSAGGARLLGILLIALLSACSGKDNSNKLVSDTSVAERMTICKDHKSDLMASIVGGCVLEGIGMESKAACEQQRDKCLAQPDNAAVNCDMAFHNLDRCHVTVAQFEDCLPQTVMWLRGLSCDAYDKRPPIPPVCSIGLNVQCPSGAARDAGTASSSDDGGA
jgi:hypothetical protein